MKKKLLRVRHLHLQTGAFLIRNSIKEQQPFRPSVRYGAHPEQWDVPRPHFIHRSLFNYGQSEWQLNNNSSSRKTNLALTRIPGE